MAGNDVSGRALGDRDASARANAGVEKAAGGAANPCLPLVEEIEVLEEQIALLEAGVPQAPGMERAALAKEVAEYRRQLEARRQALRRCRDIRGQT